MIYIRHLKLAAPIVAAISLLNAGLALAQTTSFSISDVTTPPGIASGAQLGSFPLSGFESVNLFSGGLNFSLPVFTVGGRGEASYPITVSVETRWNVIQQVSGDTTIVYPTDTESSYPGPGGYGPGLLHVKSIISTDICSTNPYTNYSATRFHFTLPDGEDHDMFDTKTGGALEPSGLTCVEGSEYGPPTPYDRGTTFVSYDGSEMTFVADADVIDDLSGSGEVVTSGYLFRKDGVRYRIDSYGNVSYIEDRNGNITNLSFCSDPAHDNPSLNDPCTNVSADADPYLRPVRITDALGRLITIEYGTPASTTLHANEDHIIYPGSTGQRTVVIKYAPLDQLLRDKTTSVQNVNVLFPSASYAGDNANVNNYLYDPTLISQIVLPNGLQYSFLYNQYGELARATLPTGGYFEYDWLPYTASVGGIPADGIYGSVMIYRRVHARRVYLGPNSLEGQTIYDAPLLTDPNPNLVVTSTDEDANSTPNLLRKTVSTFWGTPLTSATIPISNAAYFPGWREGKAYQEEIDTASGSMLRRTTNTWLNRGTGAASILPSSDLARPNDPRITQVDTTLDTNQVSTRAISYDQFNNVTSDAQYDWGQGSAGALLRTTVTSFMGSPYTDNHLLSLPMMTSVQDGGGNVVSQTNYYYDQSALTDTANIIGHDASYGTAVTVRGNLTNPAQCLNAPSCTSFANHVRTYDVAGNILTLDDANSNQTKFSYNDDGSNHYAFPTTIAPPPAANGISQASTATYDYNIAKPLSKTDANGVSAIFVYNDSLDRLTQTRVAAGTSVETQNNFTYTGANQVDIYRSLSATSTANTALHTETVYDGLGRVSQSIQYEDGGISISTDKTYDALGRLYSTTNPYRIGTSSWAQVWPCCAKTVYEYDPLNRVLSATTPDGAAVTSSYSGNQTTVNDEAGKARTTTTDALGRVTGIIEDPTIPSGPSNSGYVGLNYTTVYGYDALDNLICVNQGGGIAIGSTCQLGTPHGRSFYYDSAKRLIAVNNPESSSAQKPAQLSCSGAPTGTLWTTCYGYDAENLRSKTNNQLIQTTYVYDALNRMLSKSYSDGTAQVTYTYDVAPANTAPANSNFVGRLVQTAACCTAAGNPISTTNILGYDALGRVTASSQVTQGANLSQPVTFTFPLYQYNFASALTSETLPSGRVISTTYDSANRPTTVQSNVAAAPPIYYIGNPSVQYSPGDFVNSVQYVPHGAVWAYTRGDGITRAEEYNNRLQPIESYYSLGNVNDAAHMLFVSCPHWGSGSVGLIYPICPAGPSVANNGNLVAYDEYLGAPGMTSLTQFSQPSTSGSTITYDGVNRLTSDSDSGGWSRAFAYDQWGNMSVVPGSTGPTLGINTPQATDPTTIYNANNQRTDPGQGYDGAGNANAMNGFSNLSYDAENRLLTANAPTPFTYEYDGKGRRVTKTGAGNTTVYVYDAAGELAAEYNTSSQPTSPCSTCYLSYDHLGSVRLVTDAATHAIISRHDFLPFGEEVPAGQAGRSATLGFAVTDDVTQRFTGKERDLESGLDYFGARYYGSAVGRFTSPDPSPAGISMSDPQSWNLYAYVRNRPTRFVDQGGNWPTGFPRNYHGDIVHAALDGYLSAAEINVLVQRQVEIDKDQSPEGDQKHFMRRPGQSPADASIESWSFVTTSILLARGEMGSDGSFTAQALANFGDALHTVQDFTSPAHTDDNENPYIWRGLLNENVRFLGHFRNEQNPSVDWSRFGWAIRLSLAVYLELAPKDAEKKGLTAKNVDAEAAKRISKYVEQYYQPYTQSGGGFSPMSEGQIEALRQCALGNPAACR